MPAMSRLATKNGLQKHTPGPWEISGDIVVSAPEQCPNPKAGMRQHTICKLGWNFDGDCNATGDLTWQQAYPNMCLIAAAPQMLQALEELVAELKNGHHKMTGGFDLAIAAIAKAEGSAE